MKPKYYSVFNSVINYLNVVPYLYRYEDQEWIDSFFEKGDLLISSFDQYSKYEDNQLGDKSEGQAIVHGKSDKLHFTSVTGVGHNGYTFCTSTKLTTNLFDTFNRNSVFRIKDPLGFMLQIEKSLPRVMEVLHGNCIYLEKRVIENKIQDFTMDDLKVNDGTNNIAMDKLFNKTNEASGPEQMFLKLLKHQDQSEYRMIWNTDRKVNDNLVINVPEARQFCERVEIKNIAQQGV